MIRVYKYGARAPILNADIVQEQLRKSHKYYCALLRMTIDVQREKDRALQRLPEIKEAEAAVKELEATLNEATDRMKALRQAARKRAETETLRQTIKLLRESLKEAKAELKTRRHAVQESLKVQRLFIREEWLKQRRALRKAAKLRHGTYTMTEDAVAAACKMTPLWDGVNPNDPKFPRWQGEGHIGVQIQGGVTYKEMVRCTDTRVQLRLEPDLFQEVCKDGRGGGKRRPQFATLRLRVGSDKHRGPIWAEFPVRMHREIPAGARVKFIAVSCRKIGPREKWSTEITLDIPDAERKEECGKGTVAVDLGWRLINGELRVLTWCDEEGNSGELRLDAALISSLRYDQVLQSIRDKNLDKLKAELLAYLPEELPEWLRKRTSKKDEVTPSSAQARARIAAWKSQARFAKLAKSWEGECPDFLEAWRYHDFHLWEWEASQRAKSLSKRKDLYRNFAAQLTRTYSRIILEDFDLRRVTKNKDPEEDAENKRAKSNRHLCATSELRLAIQHAAAARGGEVVWVNAAYSTQECPHDDCRHIEAWDAERSIEREPNCPKCDRSWDQDYAAGYVLLRRFRETPPDELPKKNKPKPPRRKRVAEQRKKNLKLMREAQESSGSVV